MRAFDSQIVTSEIKADIIPIIRKREGYRTEKYVHKVQYYETDKMGITHHSNYVRWMEEARIDFFNKTGFSYKELESMGLYSPVVSVECSFRMPTTFEDCVEIEVRPEEFKGVKFVLSYEMRKCGSSDIVSTGRSVHCFIDMEGRLVLLKRTHPELNEKMKSIFHE